MAQEFVYPGSDLDRGRTLLALLGSYWFRTYTNRYQVRSYVDATASVVAQTHKNLLELVAALSRHTTPLFHEELLLPVTIRKSQMNTSVTNSALFNKTGTTFDDKLLFDVPVANDLFAFPLPDKLVDVKQLFNKITFPTVALLKDVDFVVDDEQHGLVFASNPFDNSGFTHRAIYSNNIVTDEEITLWGFCGQYDYDYIFNQFAYAVGLHLKTSQGYKDLTNAIFNALIEGGASAKNLDMAFSAISGIPLSVDPHETIEVVEEDSRGVFIATDRNVYRFAAGVTPLVAEGQTITAGTALVRGVDVREFFVGNEYARTQEGGPVYRQSGEDFLSPDSQDYLTNESEDYLILNSAETCPARKKELTALALDSGFLAACFYGDLTFENKRVPLTVNTAHRTGYTYVSFPVSGHPADAKHFFDEIHDRGIALAEKEKDDCLPAHKKLGTLAHILDFRKYAETEPKAQNLPTHINPLKFLIENVLRNNVFVVRIEVAALGQNRLGLYNIRHIRQLLPPQTAMIVLFDLQVKTDSVGGTARIVDEYSMFTGMEPVSDTASKTRVLDYGARLHLISGTCQ
jgi:hypothetical protein